MNSTEKKIESLKHRIATYKEVAASDADLIKELIASGRPDDLQFAAEKAESIARHIAGIPAMEAEIEALQTNLK
ncbi:MAG: hypothetical protein PHE09_06930 [Oscillospiraceae bacterium]|nr:hypothetical protein [Oscillospiraceae bacterium]